MRRSERIRTAEPMKQPSTRTRQKVDNYNAYDRYYTRVTYKSQIPIPEDKLGDLNWPELTKNPKAISFLEKHLDRIVWPELARNPSNDAIDLIIANKKKFNYNLYYNPCPRAIEEINKILDSPKPSPRPDWEGLLTNPGALDILQKNSKKIKYYLWYRLFEYGPVELLPLINKNNPKDFSMGDKILMLKNKREEYVKLFLDLIQNEKKFWLSDLGISYLMENSTDVAVTYILNHPDILTPYHADNVLRNTNPRILPMLEKIIENGWVQTVLPTNIINQEHEVDDDDDDEEVQEAIDFWRELSKNPAGIPLLKKYPNNIFWDEFSEIVDETCEELLEQQILKNDNSPVDETFSDKEEVNWYTLCLYAPKTLMPLIERHKDKIYWNGLSANPNAIEILNKPENIDNIDWDKLSRNPLAIELLKNNPDKINWYELSTNPSLWKQEVPELPKIVEESTVNYPKSVDSRAISNLVSQYLGGKKRTRIYRRRSQSRRRTLKRMRL